MATVTLDDLELPVTEVDDLDLSLPHQYLTEVMASDLLEILSQYQKMRLYLEGAKGIEDADKSEAFKRESLRLRMTATLIMQNHPEAKKVADQIATVKANKIVRNRETEIIGGKVS